MMVVLDQPAFECVRKDDLGFGVHPGSDGGFVGPGLVGRPVGGHVIVGRPTEAERVRLVELANGEVVELLVHERPVELAVRTFKEAVQAGEDE
jgi:hypothetical protein